MKSNHKKAINAKPCPFCGNTNIEIIYGQNDYVDYEICCMKEYGKGCACSIPADYEDDTEVGVLNKWNRRS